jgi:type IV pilus assembly protein PilN
MNSSAFNLLPWRERSRQQALRRWRWGLALCVLGSLLVVLGLDHELDQAWQQQRAQRQAWQTQVDQMQAALVDAPLWAKRQQEALRVQAQWLQWQETQRQAWRVLHQVMKTPPRGVQIESMVWREQQLLLTGWAISAAHLQAWQEPLQAQRSDWQSAVWRDMNGWAARQHRFGLTKQSGGGS